MVRVISPVVRGRRIRKYCVVSNIVRDDAAEAECRGIDRVDHRRIGSEVTQERDDRDGHDVIAKTAAVWPTTRYNAITESGLNRAREGITTENTKSIKAGIVVIREVSGARRQIHLD